MMGQPKREGKGAPRPPAAILILNRNGTRGPQSAPGSPEFRIFSTLTTLARSGSEWSQIDLDAAMLHVRRVKSGKPATHPMRCDELRALRKVSTPGTGSDLRLRLARVLTDALQGLLALTIHGTSQKMPDFRQQVSWIVAWLAFDLGKVRGASNVGGLSGTE